jgi:Mn2+/Fe2+ NRAMP family transporter
MSRSEFSDGSYCGVSHETCGDIKGAFGTIKLGDPSPRNNWRARCMTLLAIIGPGLIVMDNDAGAFGTYSQAGQDYGTPLLWALLLLIPVLYVNQEMALRLGAVTGVGFARLIHERFGKIWGAFSVIDLFLLNALIIMTEFIGISLGPEISVASNVLRFCLFSAHCCSCRSSSGHIRRRRKFSMILSSRRFRRTPSPKMSRC